MKNKFIIGGVIVLFLVVAGIYFVNNAQSPPQDTEEIKSEFTSITSDELEGMLSNKDFVLIDVHTPEQRHVPGTDFMAPYNEVEKIEPVLGNKDIKVVLYCRSGSMSKIAAQELADRGYTNVYELTGGLHDWTSRGRDTTAKGTVDKL